MTIEDVRAELKKIKATAHDYEAAHSMEDKLWEKVLRHIAENPGGGYALLAEEALKSKRIKFMRACA